MKKIIGILSATALVLAATSCASTKAESKTAEDAAATPATEAVACINNPAPTGDVLLLDSFEEGNYWQAVGDTWDQWGAHNLSLEAETTENYATDGTTGAAWTFDEATADTSKQATFFCDALVEVDWSAYKYAYIDVKNTNTEPIELQLAVQATDGWTWYQTESQKMGIGENKNVKFDLSFITKPEDATLIKRGMFNVVGENKGGTILGDNIRLANN